MAKLTFNSLPWRKIRAALSRVATILVLAYLLYWAWQSRDIISQAFTLLTPGQLAILIALLMAGLVLSAVTFVLLVRSLGYTFTYQDGYHSLNLTQIAAMIPGKIWGFAGLAGLLLARGISKADSALIILLHTLLMLSAAVLTGALALIPTWGWPVTLLALIPIVALLLGRPIWEQILLRFFPNSSGIPSQGNILLILSVGLLSWIFISGSFALLVEFTAVNVTLPSKFVTAGAFAAGYVAGFLSLITPSGLGVREGIITLILGPTLGDEQALALALVFRVLHMAVLWINILITLFLLSNTGTKFFKKKDPAGTSPEEEIENEPE